MSKVGKIEKHGLEEEVIQLHSKGNLSMNDISNVIKTRHSDISDLKKLSAMSIQRFLKRYKTEKMKDGIAKGDDIFEEIRSDFRDKMYETISETNEIWNIMKRALKNVIKKGDDYKTIKAAKDTLNAMEQTRKNWMTLIQYGTDQFGTMNKANELNIVEINNYLIDISKKLPPESRKILVDAVLKKEEELSEEEKTKKKIDDLVKA